MIFGKTLTKTPILTLSYYALLKIAVAIKSLKGLFTSCLPHTDPVVTKEEMKSPTTSTNTINAEQLLIRKAPLTIVSDEPKMFRLSKHKYLDMFWYFKTQTHHFLCVIFDMFATLFFYESYTVKTIDFFMKLIIFICSSLKDEVLSII